MGVNMSINDKSENSHISFFFLQKVKEVQKRKLKRLIVVDSGVQDWGTGRARGKRLLPLCVALQCYLVGVRTLWLKRHLVKIKCY